MGKIFSDSLQVLYVTLYQLWYAQGYQEFAGIESSVTTKVNSIINCPLLKCIDWKTVSFCLLLRIIISKVGNKAMFVSRLYMIPQPGISCYHEPVQCGKLIYNICKKKSDSNTNTKYQSMIIGTLPTLLTFREMSHNLPANFEMFFGEKI